jgi:hypothetical protein
MKTIALNKTITDEASGTTPSHHVLTNYQVDVINKKTVVTLVSFMTAAAKNPVGRISAALPGQPEGDSSQWIYDAIVAGVAPGHALTGATAVGEVEGA